VTGLEWIKDGLDPFDASVAMFLRAILSNLACNSVELIFSLSRIPLEISHV
jgi:hypothetical protein